MKQIFQILLAALILFPSCDRSPAAADATGGVAGAEPQAFDPNGYETSPVGGSSQQHAERRAADGVLLEEGFLENGKRTGSWVVYHPGGTVPRSVASYANDQYNGIYLEFNDHGYLELISHYENNLLNGYWAKYRFGRPLMEASYSGGKLNGVMREYVLNTGMLQKEITYKDGVMEGPYRFYNDRGEVTVEYQYRNGEKVGGGIVK